MLSVNMLLYEAKLIYANMHIQKQMRLYIKQKRNIYGNACAYMCNLSTHSQSGCVYIPTGVIYANQIQTYKFTTLHAFIAAWLLSICRPYVRYQEIYTVWITLHDLQHIVESSDAYALNNYMDIISNLSTAALARTVGIHLPSFNPSLSSCPLIVINAYAMVIVLERDTPAALCNQDQHTVTKVDDTCTRCTNVCIDMHTNVSAHHPCLVLDL